MNYAITFVFFFIFLLCQYAIVQVSMLVANYTNATGSYWWSIVIVVFLALNELCFGSYDFGLGFKEDEEIDEYDWNDEL